MKKGGCPFFILKIERNHGSIEIATTMSTAAMTSTPIKLAIPPIMIPVPIFRPEKVFRPVVTAQKQEEIYYESDLEYDFPSPTEAHFSTCEMCDISFEFASTRDNEICVSCEVIQTNHRRYNIALPTCSICESECYYIHRQCNRPICHHCKYNFDTCPHCKCPI
jgi:hypothetical protein